MDPQYDPQPTEESRYLYRESPFSVPSLSALFFRPRSFFSSRLAFGKKPYAVAAAWALGIQGALDRIDNEMLRAEMGRARSLWETLGPWLTDSWPNFWLYVLGLGAVSGTAYWYFGGWWYRVRLGWSGADAPDPLLARLVYIYSSFVLAAPYLLATVAQTFIHANYQAAYDSEELWPLAIVAFPFWSCYTSYAGATTAFELNRFRARLWFLALPVVVYVGAFGVLAAVFAFLAPEQF